LPQPLMPASKGERRVLPSTDLLWWPYGYI